MSDSTMFPAMQTVPVVEELRRKVDERPAPIVG